MRLLKYLAIIVLSFLTYIQSNAQTIYYGKIDKFEILPEYLINGQIKLSSEAFTEIKYKVGFVREYASMAPPPTWKPFNVTVRLSTGTDKGDIILFDAPHNITNANFKSDKVFLDTVLSGRIDNSKVVKSRPVILSYIRNNQSFPNMSFEGKSYLIEQIDVPIIPKPDPIVEADSVLFYSTGGPSRGEPSYYSLTPNRIAGSRYADQFHAYKVRVKGSRIVFAAEGTNGYRYSFYMPRPPHGNDHGFYAFENQVKGTIPIYEHISAQNNVKYTLYIDEPGFTNTRIAFYAFPPPRMPLPDWVQHKDFSIEPNQWVPNANGIGYSFDMASIIPIAISKVAKVNFIGVHGDMKPLERDPSRFYREQLFFPESYKGNNFTFKATESEIIIFSTNETNAAPNTKLDFFIQYVPKP